MKPRYRFIRPPPSKIMINYELFCHKEGINPLFFFRTVFQSSLGDFGPRFQVIVCVIIYEGFWLVSWGVSREGAFVIALWSSLYRIRLFYQRIIWRTETWAALRNNSQVYEEQQIPRSFARATWFTYLGWRDCYVIAEQRIWRRRKETGRLLETFR